MDAQTLNLTPVEQAAVEASPNRAVRPRVKGRPGHPVHLPRSSFMELDRLGGDRGPRDLMPGQDPIFLDLEDEGAILDLDEPADAARLESILKARES